MKTIGPFKNSSKGCCVITSKTETFSYYRLASLKLSFTVTMYFEKIPVGIGTQFNLS